MLTIKNIAKIIENKKVLSAWDKGVKEYALELLENIEDENEALTNMGLLEKSLLNGASDWSQYSWGGCSFIYAGQIAERLCNPSELKKTKNGQRRPNKEEEWLDTQARALQQAYWLIERTYLELKY